MNAIYNAIILMIKATLGQLSGNNVTINTTSATTPASGAGTYWSALQVISATAVIASITIDGATDTSKIATVTLPQGMIIYGNISAITLTSGTVRMYGGSNGLEPMTIL